jgi:type III secretion system FlhB-like substrate exporter
MPRGTKFTAEQIITKLREAEVFLSQGEKVPEVCRRLAVSDKIAMFSSSNKLLSTMTMLMC